MSKLNPSAFSFVPGQRFAPQQAQQPLEPIEQAEQHPPPPPTISLNITPSQSVSAPALAKRVDDVPKSSVNIQKAESSATSKTFTTEKAKTDTNTIAQDVKNAADQAVLEDLFGSSVLYLSISI